MAKQNLPEQHILIKKFYEEFIEFADFIEVRIFKKVSTGKGYAFSEWASNYEELMAIFKKYEGKEYNCYVGVNTRPTKSRKDADIPLRRTFYFDIEAKGEKPSLSDTNYFRKLSITMQYISAYLKEKYKLRPTCLVKSGRGIHLHYKVKPLDSAKYKSQFRTFFKRVQEEILKKGTEDKILPEDIKFKDSVFNVGRIASAPGTRHHKYPESPLRKILDYNYFENDLQSILDAIKGVPYDLHNDKIGEIKLNVDEKTILEKCPELKLIIDYNNLPEGELHNKIIFAVKLFVRDSKIKPEIVQKMITQAGYSDIIDIPTEEYNYSQNILINWCLENSEWALKNQYRCPYTPFALRKKVEGCKFEEKQNLEFEKKTLITFRDICNYAKDFNKKYEERIGGYRVVYAEDLKALLKENVVNKNLYDYLEFMGYIDKICLLEWREEKQGITVVDEVVKDGG